jgi:rhodanese-related sulfurtransferase
LRARLDELDRDKQYILYCAVGVCSYLGYRILLQHGFKAKNLSGGYMTYLASNGV